MAAPADTGTVTGDDVDYETLPGYGPNVRRIMGVRNRGSITAPNAGQFKKERPRFPMRAKDVPLWHYAPGEARPDGPIRSTLGKVQGGRKFVKDNIHNAERKMRLRSTPEKADIVPITNTDTDYYIHGKMAITPGKPSAWGAYKESSFGKKANSFVATSAQLLLSNYYTMFGYAHEFFYFYLYKGWYEFFLKTLVMKEMAGGLFVGLPKRIINGPDRLTDEQHAAKKELKLRQPSLQLWNEGAERALEEFHRPLTAEESALRAPTMERIRLRREGPPQDPDAPRHADIPVDNNGGNGDADARRQQYAGAGDAAPRSFAVEDPPEIPRTLWDPHRNRRRRGSGLSR